MAGAVRPTNMARVSMLMRSDLLLNSIRTNQTDLLNVQNQLASGLRLSRPSDGPADATTIMHLDSMLERYNQYQSNLEFTDGYFSTADLALGQASDLVREAYTVGLESIGMGTDDAGRQANAQMIDQIIEQLVTVGNTSYRGSYIFAGRNATELPFSSAHGGVMFTGNLQDLCARVADDNQVTFTVNANEAFGVVSSRVEGVGDLNPDITGDTLLSDLRGAEGYGVRLGSIRVSDGTNTAVIDLAGCVTVQDALDKLNAEAPTGMTFSIAADGTSFEVAAPGGDITVTEIGSGHVAHDLGIFESVGAGFSLSGQDVDARLTPATPVTALAGGAGIDLISGLQITNSKVEDATPIDLSGASTLEDILNAINNAGLGVRAEINATGTGLNVFNQLSGSQMTIGENGGTTATDLGLRSLYAETPLSELNLGQGVHTDVGNEAILVTDRAGNSCGVNLDAAETIQDVLDAINTACAGAGVAVSASLVSTGNGIELTDTSGGAGELSVTTHPDNLSGYFTAEELGLAQSVSANSLTGEDVNPASPAGLFTHLLDLRDALLRNDDAAITAATEALSIDEETIQTVQGQVGAQARGLEDRRTQMEDNILSMETLRSDLRDIDFTEAITRYQNLYAALQGNLITGQQLTNVSLLDFLS